MKTYKGKTAGGWLKSAKIVRMQAGNDEIEVAPDLYAMLGERASFGGGTVRDVLVLHNVGGVIARLETSKAAYNKLRALEGNCNA